jgi:hypothetical protein
MINTAILGLVITLLLIFLFLSLLHFYWGFGGKWGIEVALPSLEDNIPLFRPGKLITLLIAFVLLICAGFFLLIIIGLAQEVMKYFFWVILIVFASRVIGDFKFFGLFKIYKHTRFAVNDSKYYTPLSLLISIFLLILLVWMSRSQDHRLIYW